MENKLQWICVSLLIFSLNANSLAHKTLPILKKEIERIETERETFEEAIARGFHYKENRILLAKGFGYFIMATLMILDGAGGGGVTFGVLSTSIGMASWGVVGTIFFGNVWDGDLKVERAIPAIKEELARYFPEEYQILLDERGERYVEGFILDVLAGWSVEKLDETYGTSWPESLIELGHDKENEILFEAWLETKTGEELAASREILKAYFLEHEIDEFRRGFLGE